MAKLKADALCRCLTEAKLPDTFVSHCLDKLKMESLDDFVNIVTIKDYETEIKTVLVDQCNETKDNPLHLSRARAAWRAARTSILRAEHRKQQGETVEEIECALEHSTQETLLQTFQHTYQIEIDVHYMPADTLLGRLYRECQRLTPTVIAVSKIKSLFAASKPKNDKTIQLGEQVRLKLDQEEHIPIRSVMEYYRSLRILAYGYAIVGQHKMPSKEDPGKDVTFAPLSDNLRYPDTILRICCTALSDMAPSSLLDFVRARDECTRARMIELVRQGYPQGEALNKSWREQELRWTLPPQPKRSLEPESSGTGGSPGKKFRTATHLDGQAICKPHNDNRGCDGDCGKLNVCDVILPDGKVCGSKKHNRFNCPHRAKQR